MTYYTPRIIWIPVTSDQEQEEGEEEEAYIATPVSRSIFFMMRLPQSAHEFMGMNSPLETPHEIHMTPGANSSNSSSFLLPPPPNFSSYGFIQGSEP